ncbi:hypothetical protein PROFUN_02953 [Planoprotostelium fungivorum]|uniref:Potassium channel tetramerisation-type BTB domain-containing protein n=1 Tax=Planoprotostelium fungivorum TaxID=1890364 RepID=A0A2P6NX60_9EUKA|nr:hypothetical protein PROFUN_02953 [Planoprotostelium fungivorum]
MKWCDFPNTNDVSPSFEAAYSGEIDAVFDSHRMNHNFLHLSTPSFEFQIPAREQTVVTSVFVNLLQQLGVQAVSRHKFIVQSRFSFHFLWNSDHLTPHLRECRGVSSNSLRLAKAKIIRRLNFRNFGSLLSGRIRVNERAASVPLTQQWMTEIHSFEQRPQSKHKQLSNCSIHYKPPNKQHITPSLPFRQPPYDMHLITIRDKDNFFRSASFETFHDMSRIVVIFRCDASDQHTTFNTDFATLMNDTSRIMTYHVDEHNRMFIDRAPRSFGLILSYLETGKLNASEMTGEQKLMLVEDVEFFHIRGLRKLIMDSPHFQATLTSLRVNESC